MEEGQLSERDRGLGRVESSVTASRLTESVNCRWSRVTWSPCELLTCDYCWLVPNVTAQSLYGREAAHSQWTIVTRRWHNCCPRNGTLCQVQYSLWPSLAFSYIGNVTARHSISGRQPNFVAFTRGRHLYLAGRSSSWPLAHILVVVVVCYCRLQKKYHVCIDTGKTSHVHMSIQSNSKVMMLMMGILW